MLDLKKASQFIMKRGSALEKERLRCLLTGERGDQRYFPLERVQNSDFGIALNFRPGNPSCINNTGVARLCLWEMNLLTPELDHRLGDFIAGRCNQDGIFVDPYETVSFHLPIWMEVGTFRFALYYSLFSVCELLKIDYTYHKQVDKSLAIFTDVQRSDGSMPGYLHNSWMAAGVFLLDGALRQAEKVLEYLDAIPIESWEGSQLVWALEVLVDAGLGLENGLVAKWFDWLEWMQNPNGSFTSEDDERMNPDVTLNALRVVKKLGMLENCPIVESRKSYEKL